jgi:hypothetical protein
MTIMAALVDSEVIFGICTSSFSSQPTSCRKLMLPAAIPTP